MRDDTAGHAGEESEAWGRPRPGSDMYALVGFFPRRKRGSQDVMKSISTDDKGGGGPTFIKVLVALVEGAAEIRRPIVPSRCCISCNANSNCGSMM